MNYELGIFRLGRKSKRTILWNKEGEKQGQAYIIFPEGFEKEAEEYCDYLNKKKAFEDFIEIFKKNKDEV